MYEEILDEAEELQNELPGPEVAEILEQRGCDLDQGSPGRAAYLCLVIVTTVVVVWTLRQGWAVHKLRRGVGDTWFYSADGKPWFRMDEQRRDVSLDEIAPDMRNAVIAVEDHRFYRHFGIDPIGTARAL